MTQPPNPNPGQPGGPTPPNPNPVPPQPGGPTPPNPAPPQPETVDQLPEWAQKEIREARQQAGTYRNQLRDAQQGQQAQADIVTKIAQALGIQADGGKVTDPNQVTDQVKQAQAASRAAAVELAVFRASSKLGADGEALLDSRAFLDAVKDLDPASQTFTTEVEQAIKDAITKNGKFKIDKAPSAPRSGAEITGGAPNAPVDPGKGQDRLRSAYASAASQT